MQRHLSDNILRISLEEPQMLLSYEKAHLARCARCAARLNQIGANAGVVKSGNTGGDFDIAEARDTLAQRMRSSASTGGAARMMPDVADSSFMLSAIPLRAALAVAAAIVLIAFIGYAPLRGAAQSMLAIFQPKTFQAVTIRPNDFARGGVIPRLHDFGNVRVSGPRSAPAAYSDSGSASRAAGFAVLHPQQLPPSVPRTAFYRIVAQHSISFTFSAQKALAFAARRHTAIPAMPPNLNGSTLSSTLGPVVMQIYGSSAMLSQMNAGIRRGMRGHHNFAHRLPDNTIFITQAPAPKVFSDGATVAQIENYLASMPNVPADVAAQIKAIGDPSSTAVIPVPVQKATAQQVTVHGAQGLLVGDNTGIGAAVLWQQNGMVYAVAGPFSATQVLQVANSLAP